MTDPDYSPIRTRAEAEAAFAGFRDGPRGGITSTASEHKLDALVDTLETLIAPADPLGEYDLAVIGKVAAALDPVDVEVLNSLIRRAAHDQPLP